jgi:hypothetical protein
MTEENSLANSIMGIAKSIQETPGLMDGKIFSKISVPKVRNPMLENIESNFASEFYKRLTKIITEFDASLDNAHEVGVRLVSFGQTVVFHLDSMGYYNPSLISFHGYTEDGNPVELIQHVSQISILLTKLTRKDPLVSKKPIGFAAEQETKED